MRRTILTIGTATALGLAALTPATAAPGSQQIGVNVVLSTDITQAILSDLSTHGQVNDTYPELDAVTMRLSALELPKIRALPYVKAANQDARRVGKPVPGAPANTDVTDDVATWDTDQIDVTDVPTDTRTVTQTGAGVYVAIIDTGLLSSWPTYFGTDRIAADLGVAFGGGGGEKGNVSTQPNKWQLDQNSHGTHVASTILGYNLNGTRVAGVAPEATVIPVKVLNQNGSGWSSMVAAGINYVTDLKLGGRLGTSPVVINMSLGGPDLDALEQAAIDRAIANGVLIVAAAGNEGEAGMGYPGAYAPVISAAATGFTGQWTAAGWWNSVDVPEGDAAVAATAYIADFSSRELAGQDLDLAAPGSLVVGPYQVNSQTSFYYLSGTSMASPHVAGA
ncbi:MAG TPA: S8 family serine peptidase, partial [Actinotalea sp.]